MAIVTEFSETLFFWRSSKNAYWWNIERMEQNRTAAKQNSCKAANLSWLYPKLTTEPDNPLKD